MHIGPIGIGLGGGLSVFRSTALAVREEQPAEVYSTNAAESFAGAVGHIAYYPSYFAVFRHL